MAALKVIFIVGIVAGIIIVANTILRGNNSEGLFGLFSSASDEKVQTGRPLETVPNLIQKRP